MYCICLVMYFDIYMLIWFDLHVYIYIYCYEYIMHILCTHTYVYIYISLYELVFDRSWYTCLLMSFMVHALHSHVTCVKVWFSLQWWSHEQLFKVVLPQMISNCWRSLLAVNNPIVGHPRLTSFDSACHMLANSMWLPSLNPSFNGF